MNIDFTPSPNHEIPNQSSQITEQTDRLQIHKSIISKYVTNSKKITSQVLKKYHKYITYSYHPQIKYITDYTS